MKPSDLIDKQPWDSIAQDSNVEDVARNIMKILARKGDQFRSLTWEEYEKERLKDGNFDGCFESMFFVTASINCLSENKARYFSQKWDI